MLPYPCSVKIGSLARMLQTCSVWQVLMLFDNHRKFYGLFRLEALPTNSLFGYGRFEISPFPILSSPNRGQKQATVSPVFQSLFRRGTNQAISKPSLNGRQRWDAKPN